MKKSDIRKQVEEFMIGAKQEIKSSPAVPDEKIVRLRAKLVMEEAFELIEALFELEQKLNYDERSKLLQGQGSDYAIARATIDKIIERNDLNVDMVEVADACGDIDYVVEGARLAFGINGKPIADEVQRTNMAKFGPGSWVRESDGKQMKPPGWEPPDIAKLLKDQE
jgi:predicted HAD superfamily Cof-like phosphohydrolase